MLVHSDRSTKQTKVPTVCKISPLSQKVHCDAGTFLTAELSISEGPILSSTTNVCVILSNRALTAEDRSRREGWNWEDFSREHLPEEL